MEQDARDEDIEDQHPGCLRRAEGGGVRAHRYRGPRQRSTLRRLQSPSHRPVAPPANLPDRDRLGRPGAPDPARARRLALQGAITRGTASNPIAGHVNSDPLPRPRPATDSATDSATVFPPPRALPFDDLSPASRGTRFALIRPTGRWCLHFASILGTQRGIQVQRSTFRPVLYYNHRRRANFARSPLRPVLLGRGERGRTWTLSGYSL